jgi:hypothetical protein
MKTQATQVLSIRSSIDATLDETFPDSALSRVRRTLREFTDTVQFDPNLENEARFNARRPWWKRW